MVFTFIRTVPTAATDQATLGVWMVFTHAKRCVTQIRGVPGYVTQVLTIIGGTFDPRYDSIPAFHLCALLTNHLR